LLSAGRKQLETELHYRPPLGKRLLALVLDHPNTFYFGTLAVV
jgi:hypothetical protein